MSPRESIDRQRIRQFLDELSKRFRRPVRIYLVGGSTLVYEELRDQTLDIDLAIDVAPEDHGVLMSAIRELKETLSVNVEEASPADFIPLPAGHDLRHIFVARFGEIDVFHFDPYSTALSKIERGQTQDFEDVLALLESETIAWDRLVECYAEIRPRIGAESLKQDPVEFERNFRALERMRH